MAEVTYKEANRRYRRVLIPTTIVYVALVFGGTFVLESVLQDPPVWVLAAGAALMAAPIGLIMIWMWRLLQETDEFTRTTQLRSLAASGMVTATIATLWGFLEIYAAIPKVGVFMLGPIFFGIYGLMYSFVFKGGCEPGFGE